MRLSQFESSKVFTMPIYVYESIVEEGTAAESFEFVQKMSDPPLASHPETGAPIRRVLTSPRIGGRWSDSAMNQSITDDNLKRRGFTKYVKTGDGSYEKTLGSGPSTLSGD